MNFLLGFGIVCMILEVGASDLNGEALIFKPFTNKVDKQYKKNNLLNSRGPLSFLLPEWDEPSINHSDGKLKEMTKNRQEEMDLFVDMTDGQVGKVFKQKKRPKEKFLMTFKEVFMPLTIHKNFDLPSITGKFDFFEDFFKDFPFKDLEEPLLKHKTQKRFSDFNPFIPFARNTSSSNNDSLNMNATLRNKTKKIEVRKHGSLLRKPNEALVLLHNNINGTIPVCCAGHTECKMNMHCKQGMCREQDEVEESIYMTRIKEMTNINKLSRIMLLYAVPILLGIGGIVIATEIIRKHNAVKQVQFIKEYEPIQNC